MVSERTPRPVLNAASDVAWRVLVIAGAVLATVFAMARLRAVLLPIFIALLLTTILVPPVRWLQQHGWRRLPATWLVFLAFLGSVVAVFVVLIPEIADEFEGLGETVSAGVDDIEEWLIEGPLDLEPEQLERYRERAADQASTFAQSSGGLVTGAVLVVEGIAGTLLALVVTFFFVKDRDIFRQWTLDHLPPEHHEFAREAAARAWRALGGFLRAAALIGFLEGTIIGVTLWLVGAKLAIPVAILTFIGAFFPIVGAVAAGILASLVALVSGGPGDALVVAAVALAVQQFDNDLLAPLIYGRIIRLHPVVVLLALATGGSIAGILGAFLAVPVTAMAVAVGSVAWQRRQAETKGLPEAKDAPA
jgi:putative heme transporter